MVGGNASFQTSKGEDAPDDSRVTTVEFNPNVGYFFIDNLAGVYAYHSHLIRKKGKMKVSHLC
jgi:hypothetical protein